MMPMATPISRLVARPRPAGRACGALTPGTSVTGPCLEVELHSLPTTPAQARRIGRQACLDWQVPQDRRRPLPRRLGAGDQHCPARPNAPRPGDEAPGLDPGRRGRQWSAQHPLARGGRRGRPAAAESSCLHGRRGPGGGSHRARQDGMGQSEGPVLIRPNRSPAHAVRDRRPLPADALDTVRWGGRDSNPRPRDYESPALTG
jgi:hypothetical protein